MMSEGGHVYEGERCIFCNVNVYDNMIYNDDAPCPVVPGVDRPLYHYTTETGDASVFEDLPEGEEI